MKTYKEFITELNKFERFLLKQGVKAIKKLNPRMPLKTVKKDALGTTKGLRGDPYNPFVSPRREAENFLRRFQRQTTGPGKNLERKSTKGVKYYNPSDAPIETELRQTDMRGSSKKLNRNIERGANLAGDTNTKTVIQNTGDQHSQIYKAPQYKFSDSDKKIDDLFTKNKLGAPTTTNIPKDKLSDLDRFTPAKDIKAKSKIKPFKRNKPK